MTEKRFLSGFAAIAGRPNTGKSTLLNRLAGGKIAIVSDKPQTTRNKINAVVTTESYQIAFIDTPGLHNPKTKLSEYMMKSAEKNMTDADVTIFMAEPVIPSKKDLAIIEKLKTLKCPVFLVINKIDAIKKEKLLGIINEYRKLHDFAEILSISALNGENTDILLDLILKYLPEGPKYYDDDYLTDQPERQIISEVIREKALVSLQDEIPHGVAVVVEKMRERSDGGMFDIDAVIICERDSHKGIIIGKKGAMLRKIGVAARLEIEEMLSKKVNLQLWVKVKKDWRNNALQVKSFGYDIKKI